MASTPETSAVRGDQYSVAYARVVFAVAARTTGRSAAAVADFHGRASAGVAASIVLRSRRPVSQLRLTRMASESG